MPAALLDLVVWAQHHAEHPSLILLYCGLGIYQLAHGLFTTHKE